MEQSVSKPLNDLARHQMIVRLLADIAVDLQVCELEGWDKGEYITILHEEIDKFYEQLKSTDNEQKRTT